MTDELTHTLLDTISDPLVLNQKRFLSPKQVEVVDALVDSKALPAKVDDFFVNSILALLKDYEPVFIRAEDLVQKLEQLPPMDEVSFKQKINEFISTYTRGKDASTLRIVVKSKESEE